MKKPVQSRLSASLWLAVAGASLIAMTTYAQAPVATKGATASKPAAGVTITGPSKVEGSGTDFSTIGPVLNLVTGKSTLVRLPWAIDRVSMGNPIDR